MPKPRKPVTRKTVKPIKVSPLNDIVVAAMFTDVKSAGLAAEHLVKDVLGEYGKRLGKVISVRTQDYHKLANFRGTRVDVVCRTVDNELWLIEFQMYDDEFMFERNMVECSYLIIESTESGTTVEEMAEDIPHIVVINFLNFTLRTDNPDWLQPAHITYDKEPRRIAYDKLEIFNIQFPVFMKQEPDFEKDGDCWLYVMYKAHTLEITPQEVIEMEPRLSRFATKNPGFEQYQIQLHRALADPEVMEELRMAAKARISEAGMKRTIEKNAAKEIALNFLGLKIPIEKIAQGTGLSLDDIRTLQKDLE
jgi:predicted transposase/invertase (TIGR01784 family)